jgi:hypothetical protein
MAGHGGLESLQRGRDPSATEYFHIGSQRFDEIEFEGVQRGRPAPRVDFSHDWSRRIGCGRNQGASLRASSGSVRDYGPGGAVTLAEVNDQATTTTWHDSTRPTCPQSQVSDHSNLQFSGFGRGNENLHDLGRSQGHGCGLGFVRPEKGKNFVPEEERQLIKSALAIYQDPICGNQQNGNALWERIYLHYEHCRPSGHRGAQSLESKWGTIKHDVGKFIFDYNQIKRLNKSGTKKTDIIRMAKDLYCIKTAKDTEFMFEHCWALVKDFPQWADGVSPS